MGREFPPARFFAHVLSRGSCSALDSFRALAAALPCLVPLSLRAACTRDERAKASMTARGRGSIAVLLAAIVPSVPWGGSESMACPNGDGKKSRGGPHSLLGTRRRSLTRHLQDSVVDAAGGRSTAALLHDTAGPGTIFHDALQTRQSGCRRRSDRRVPTASACLLFGETLELQAIVVHHCEEELVEIDKTLDDLSREPR